MKNNNFWLPLSAIAALALVTTTDTNAIASANTDLDLMLLPPGPKLSAPKPDENAHSQFDPEEFRKNNPAAQTFLEWIASKKGTDTEVKALLKTAPGLDKYAVDQPSEREGDPGGTILEVAADNNRADLVKALLEAGVDPNYGISVGPLCHAAAQGNKEIVEVLLKSGAKINPPFNPKFGSPLEHALKNRHLELAKFLVTSGAKVGPLEATGLGDLAVVKNFSKEDIRKAADDRSVSPLTYAVINDDKETVRYLLSLGFTPEQIERNTAQDDNPLDLVRPSVTPLFVYAAKNADLEMMELLLKSGAAIDTTQQTLEERLTALHHAVSKNNEEMVRFLLDHGADANGKFRGSTTPLFLACQNENLAIVTMLLNKGANPSVVREPHQDRRDSDVLETVNDLPLGKAIAKDNLALLKLLIENKANVNGATPGGVTPLHLAAAYERLEMAKLLLQAKARINTKNIRLQTPLDYAYSPQKNAEQSKEVIKYLRSQGAVCRLDSKPPTQASLNQLLVKTQSIKVNLVKQEVPAAKVQQKVFKSPKELQQLKKFLVVNVKPDSILTNYPIKACSLEFVGDKGTVLAIMDLCHNGVLQWFGWKSDVVLRSETKPMDWIANKMGAPPGIDLGLDLGL